MPDLAESLAWLREWIAPFPEPADGEGPLFTHLRVALAAWDESPGDVSAAESWAANPPRYGSPAVVPAPVPSQSPHAADCAARLTTNGFCTCGFETRPMTLDETVAYIEGGIWPSGTRRPDSATWEAAVAASSAAHEQGSDG